MYNVIMELRMFVYEFPGLLHCHRTTNVASGPWHSTTPF